MSNSYYKIEFKPDEEFCTRIRTYKDCFIYRKGNRPELWVYDNKGGTFIRTEFKSIDEVIEKNTRWYVSHEKVNRNTAYEFINKIKMMNILVE